MKWKEVRTPFRFEKIRLLHRAKHIELWEGFAKDRPQIIKRFLSAGSLWTDFLLQSRIKHPVFLDPQFAGPSRDGFCFGLPIDFTPEPLSERFDLSLFVIQLLSLAHALNQKKIIFKWNPEHILLDPKSGRVFLAGFNRMRQVSASECAQNGLQLLATLRVLVAKRHNGNPDLEKMLRKWERRKPDQLDGCLQSLIVNFDVSADEMVSTMEWPRSKELELVTGLFQLAERGSGRAIHFQGDPGEGKSTLLKQIHCELFSRNCSTAFFFTTKNDHPHDSARKLLELLSHNAGLASPPQTKVMTEDRWISAMLKTIAKQNKRGAVCAILMDDLHYFDPASFRSLHGLLRQIQSYKVLFILTSRGNIDLPDSVISLSMDPAPLTNFLEAYHLPFWKQQQRATYIEKIYERTSGNPLLFGEYVKEAVRHHKSRNSWEDGEWFFASNDLPSFPDALMDFYLKRIPSLSEEELVFLQQASVQGERFDPLMVEKDEVKRDALLQSLVSKGLISQTRGSYCFRKALLAEAFYNKLDPELLNQFHRSLAQQLLKKDSREFTLSIARHFLKGGDYDQAFQMAKHAIAELGKGVEVSVLGLYEELLPFSNQLQPGEESAFHQELGKLHYRRGNYPAAAFCFERAVLLSLPDSAERFSLAVRLADTYLLNNEVLRAEKILQEQQRSLKTANDQRTLFQYYLSRGICSSQRGPRQESDFANAFAIAESLEDYQALSQGYRQQAVLALRDGHITEARSSIRKSLLFAQRIHDQEQIGHGLRILASIAWRESKHQLADRLLRRSIRAFKRVQNLYGVACVWNLLGNVLVERCRLREAVNSFQKALTLLSRFGHPHEVTLAQFNLGLAFLEQGRLKEAEKIFLRCRQIDKNAGNRLSFAYDLRALGVLSMVRGFHKRATRLLKRTIEFCEELRAEGDLIQTKMILLFNELQRKNYKDCHPLAEFLQKQLPYRQEPMTKAEIHYLLAHYFGFTQQSQDALNHIEESLRLSKKIRHHKLTGQNLILRLILKGNVPRRNDTDLKQAFRSFRLSRNQLESASYFLQFYQAYPSLLREKFHLQNLMEAEKVFRQVQHRPKHRMLRQLARTASSNEVSIQPFYDWWQRLLQLFHGSESLEPRFRQVLRSLSEEIHASFRSRNGGIIST